MTDMRRRCGNSPAAQLTDGDRQAVAEFCAYLAERKAAAGAPLSDEQHTAIRQRIAVAIRDAAFDCCDTTSPSGCSLTDRECLAQHPLQITAWYDASTLIGAVNGDVEHLADIAAAVVQPELDRLRAELATARAALAGIQADAERADRKGYDLDPADIAQQARTGLDAAPSATT
jgi:hypothetical protein